MTTALQHNAPAPVAEPLDTTVVTSWKAPIAFAIFTLAALALAVFAPRDGETTFRLSTQADVIQLPEITVPSMPALWITIVLLALATAYSAMLVASKRKVPLWLIVVFAILFMFGFLTWAASGAAIPVIGLLFGSLSLAVPLIYGSLTGVIGERVGVINIAIEGQLLAGAFTAAVVASLVSSSTGVPWLGLIAGTIGAMVAGLLVGMVLAAFSIKYFVDQVIVGVVLNVLVIGLTSFFFSQVLSPNAGTLNTPPRFERLPIPLLS